MEAGEREEEALEAEEEEAEAEAEAEEEEEEGSPRRRPSFRASSCRCCVSAARIGPPTATPPGAPPAAAACSIAAVGAREAERQREERDGKKNKVKSVTSFRSKKLLSKLKLYCSYKTFFLGFAEYCRVYRVAIYNTV